MRAGVACVMFDMWMSDRARIRGERGERPDRAAERTTEDSARSMLTRSFSLSVVRRRCLCQSAAATKRTNQRNGNEPGWGSSGRMRPAFSDALCLFAPILRQRSEAADEMLAVAVGIGCEVPAQNGQNEYCCKCAN